MLFQELCGQVEEKSRGTQITAFYGKNGASSLRSLLCNFSIYTFNFVNKFTTSIIEFLFRKTAGCYFFPVYLTRGIGTMINSKSE